MSEIEYKRKCPHCKKYLRIYVWGINSEIHGVDVNPWGATCAEEQQDGWSSYSLLSLL